MANENVAAGDMKIYPACEIRAVDMAEVLRVAIMFEGERRDGDNKIAVNGGVIQGCRLDIPNDMTNRIRMTPGRIIIFGRLAEFKAPEGSSYIYLQAPSVSSNNTTCYIVAVCNLADPENPFYVSIVTGVGTLNAAANHTSDSLFNVNNGLRYLRLGTVQVSTSGTFSNLVTNDASYTIKSNKSYVDSEIGKLSSSTTESITALQEWRSYFKLIADTLVPGSNTPFFKTYTSSADGLTLKANTVTTFKFRKEYDSITYLNAQTVPASLNAWINLKADGTVLSQQADQVPDIIPAPSSHNVPTAIRTKYRHLAICGVLIQNATNGSAGLSNLVLRGFYTDSSNHVCVDIKNTGSTAAKFKLSITSLYARDI